MRSHFNSHQRMHTKKQLIESELRLFFQFIFPAVIVRSLFHCIEMYIKEQTTSFSADFWSNYAALIHLTMRWLEKKTKISTPNSTHYAPLQFSDFQLKKRCHRRRNDGVSGAIILTIFEQKNDNNSIRGSHCSLLLSAINAPRHIIMIVIIKNYAHICCGLMPPQRALNEMRHSTEAEMQPPSSVF